MKPQNLNTLPEDLDTLSDADMAALAQQLNEIEPGAHLSPVTHGFLWDISMLDLAYILAGASTIALLITAILLLFPTLTYKFGISKQNSFQVRMHKSFGDFYNRYFS